jgi:peptidoglycan hydrolase-like protein with peptidoglycan-binding domain
MSKRTWLCYLGAVLLTSAAPVVLTAAQPAATQSSAKKKRSTSSKKKSNPTKKSKPTAGVQKTPTPDRIREIQSALMRESALAEEPTGKWDNATVEAMKKYQGDHGLNPTGKIDALTLQKLGLGSQTAGKGAPILPASSAGPPSNPAP